MSEAPGPINFTMFLTMFGEKLNGTDPEDVIRNAFACFDEEASGLWRPYHHPACKWGQGRPRHSVPLPLRARTDITHLPGSVTRTIKARPPPYCTCKG